MIRQFLAYNIIALYDSGNGWSKSKIAKYLEISKGTVSKYANFSVQEIVKYYENLQRTKKLDQYHEKIQFLLHKNPKISAKDVRTNLLSQEDSLDVSVRTINRYIKKENASQGFYEKIQIQNELWYRRIIQGELPLTELKAELSEYLSHSDIEI